MSIKLMSLVWELDLPPGEKLVLLALADQANDEGRQCWPSVETIGQRSGQGERTVRRALASLEEKQHLTRQHRDGTSTQYHVHPCQNGRPAKLAPLPKTTKTPAKLAPKPSRTTSNKQTARVMPDDWLPVPFGEKSKCSPIVESWTADELETQIEHFTAHHRGKGSRFVDWQDAWKTWVLNSRKWGGARSARAPPVDDYLHTLLAKQARNP